MPLWQRLLITLATMLVMKSRRWPLVALALQYRYSELSERGCRRSYRGAGVGVPEKDRHTLTDCTVTAFPNAMNLKWWQ